MKVRIKNINKRVSFIHRRDVKKAIAAGVDLYAKGTNCVVYITFCDDSYIKEINHLHRDKDSETDVLSFPLIEWEKPLDWESLKVGEDINPEDNSVELGDIIISLDAVKRQAKEYGHSPKREICYLAVHGLMHLMGFDHMNDEDKKVMRKHEEQVMTKINEVR